MIHSLSLPPLLCVALRRCPSLSVSPQLQSPPSRILLILRIFAPSMRRPHRRIRACGRKTHTYHYKRQWRIVNGVRVCLCVSIVRPVGRHTSAHSQFSLSLSPSRNSLTTHGLYYSVASKLKLAYILWVVLCVMRRRCL